MNTNNIADLTPAEKCLLYNALQFFKTNAEEAYAECVTTAVHPTVNKLFFAHTEKAIKQLIEKLFADTFIDELEFVKQFNKSLLENRPASIPPVKDGVIQA